MPQMLVALDFQLDKPKQIVIAGNLQHDDTKAMLREVHKEYIPNKVILLAEYDPVVWDDPAFAAEQQRMTKALLACAARNGLTTIDSFDTLAATGAPRKLYVTWHMNEPGNRLIAGLVAEKLR